MNADARRLVIGLTGNLGAGKSTVARMAQRLGARVIDSDRTVRELLAADAELAAEIERAFGPAVMRGGWPNRAALAETVFHDPQALHRLERLVFPRVGRRTAELLRQPTEAPATLVEAIKVVEGPTGAQLDGLWIVVAAPELQVARAAASGRITAAQARRRLAVQSPPEEKARRFAARRPDRPIWRIENLTDTASLQRRVETVWRATLASAGLDSAEPPHASEPRSPGG